MHKETAEKFKQGLLTFARYAFAPNYYKYCGPDKSNDLAEALVGHYDERGLLEILSQFEAAVPYLNLIARSNNISDIFDQRVVSAYWLGNNLLFKVPSKLFYQTFSDVEIKKRAGKNFHQIKKQLLFGAKPHHSFHVFDIYRFAGLSKTGKNNIDLLKLINNCRISWGRVRKIDDEDQLIEVESEKIIEKIKKLKFENCRMKVKNISLKIKEGDLVSTHWGFVCDKITKTEANNLHFWTEYHLNITNQAI